MKNDKKKTPKAPLKNEAPSATLAIRSGVKAGDTATQPVPWTRQHLR